MNRIEKVKRLSQMYYHYRMKHTVLPYFPIRLWVETTNQCNLRCKFCPNATDHTSERGNMSMDLYKKIIRQLSGKSHDLNLSHRGEPLFHPELEEMIRYAKQHDLSTRIHTNATKLSPDRSNEMLDSPPDLISFSFDGYDKETYESVRIGGIFEETLENIYYFLDEKKKRGLNLPYTIIQIIEPPEADRNYLDNLKIFGDQMMARGLDKFYIKKPHNWGGNADGSIENMNGFLPCTFIYYSLTILYDGTVCPCPQDWYATMPLGNANQQTIEEIWNGQTAKNMRQRMTRRDLNGLLCQNCDRVFRSSFLGIPMENAKAFLGETLAGYNFVRKLIRR